MLGTAPLGRVPLGAIPVWLYVEVRIRTSPLYISTLDGNDAIFSDTTGEVTGFITNSTTVTESIFSTTQGDY